MPLLLLVLLAVTAVPLLGEAAVPAGTTSGDCTDSLNDVVYGCQRTALKLFKREQKRDTEYIKRELRSLQGQVTTLQGQLASLDQRLSPAGGGTGSCPAGWSHRGSSCYLVPMMKLPWLPAQQTCTLFDHRARLASIHTGNKDHVAELIAHQSEPVWVGLYHRVVGDGWAWIDGSLLDFENWAPEDPVNRQGRLIHEIPEDQLWDLLRNSDVMDFRLPLGPQHCGRVLAQEATWRDSECEFSHQFLCQIKLTQP